MADRYNLSHAMYTRLMGRFLDMRRSGSQPTSATDAALERRGLLDEHGRRTEAGLIYIEERCNFRNTKFQERNPGVVMIHDDEGFGLLFNEQNPNDDVDVYVYAGSSPMVVNDGNGQTPLALLSHHYMWKTEVEQTAGKFLTVYSIMGHKGSYGYRINRSYMEAAAANTMSASLN